jgi:hypothetical protein
MGLGRRFGDLTEPIGTIPLKVKMMRDCIMTVSVVICALTDELLHNSKEAVVDPHGNADHN